MWRAAVLSLALAMPAAAQDRAAVEAQFQTWLEEVIWPAVAADGVPRATFDAAFGDVSLNWDLPSLLPPGAPPEQPTTTRQAEFQDPARYFDEANLAASARIGAQMAVTHAATLDRIEARYGVPGHIVLAIWGRESAYGAAPITNDPFEVLATKGFMGRNAEMFTAETIAVLKIAALRGVSPGQMTSSWAGALGQPQFLPTSYLDYGADGDGHGVVDIWDSEPDTLASIGNYLAEHGWQRGRDWGFEVRLPDNLSCALEGPDNRRSISDWVGAGVTRVSGRPFPDPELDGAASLLFPAGTNGPVFLVSPNFYVLKRYNTSDLYALFVGHVGDRIAYGVSPFTADWGGVDTLLRSDVAAMQETLEGLGYDVGGADGLVGYKTRRSIGAWQASQGRTPTCFPDSAVVSDLSD